MIFAGHRARYVGMAAGSVKAGVKVGQCGGVKVGQWRYEVVVDLVGKGLWSVAEEASPQRGVPGAGGGSAFGGWGSFAAALLEAVAVAVHLEDVDVMREAIQQSAGEAFRTEDFGPLLERQVGGDHGRAAFVALAEHLEQQLGAGLRQWHEAQFIDDQQFIGSNLLLESQQLLLVARFDQLADQRGGGGEADAVTTLAGGETKRQRDVRLTGAARSWYILLHLTNLLKIILLAPEPTESAGCSSHPGYA